MDSDNPPSAQLSALSEVLDNSIDGSNRERLHISNIDVDMYVLSEEAFGSSCVRFTGIAENYKDPIFFGKIYSNSYKIRWKINAPLHDVLSSIRQYILELEELDNADDDEEDDEPFSYELEGLNIVQESLEDDIIIPLDMIPDTFWNNPVQYLQELRVTELEAIYIYTTYGEISLAQKGKDGTLRNELCVISHLERHSSLAKLIRNTHCLIFDEVNEPLNGIETALSGFKRTFSAHFQNSAVA